MSNLRYELTITEEVKSFYKEVKKVLKEKGYKTKTERHNCYIGAIHINTKIDYFIKGNTLFEIEQDLDHNEIYATLHTYNNNKKEHIYIRLADIKELA